MALKTKQELLDLQFTKAELKAYARGNDIVIEADSDKLTDLLDAYEKIRLSLIAAADELPAEKAAKVESAKIDLPREIDGMPVIHGDRGALRDLKGNLVNTPYYKVFVEKDPQDPHPVTASANDNKVKVPRGKWVVIQEPYVQQLEERKSQTLIVPRPPKPGSGAISSHETGAVVVNDWQPETFVHFHMRAEKLTAH